MSSTSSPGTFLGHPRGLFVLFFTEMWERFNYYGMRAALPLYMLNSLRYSQESSSRVYKWFTALCYLTPILGGFVADRFLGNRWAIIIGAAIMAAGQFCMTVEDQRFFFVALGLLVAGNGLFKPNMATQVGRLYPPNDARRDSAYTIFYMGVNLGAMIGPIVCGWLRQKYGFGYAFGAAGAGMLLALIIYQLLGRWVQEPPSAPPEIVRPPSRAPGPAARKPYMTEEEANLAPSLLPRLTRSAPTLIVVVAVAAALACTGLHVAGLINIDEAIAFGLGTVIASLLGAIVMRHVQGAARDRVLTIYLLGLFVVFFWAAFEQAGNAMNIFADKTTDLYLTEKPPEPSVFPAVEGQERVSGTGSWWSRWFNPMPTEWFQSINAAAIILFAPLIAWLWVFLPRIGISLSIPAKMGIGVFLQGMAFALMIWAIRYENQPSSAELAALPRGVTVDGTGRVVFDDPPNPSDPNFDEKLRRHVDPTHAEVVNGGRIRFDAAAKRLDMTGVLADTDRDRLLRPTAPPEYVLKLRELVLASRRAEPDQSVKAAVQLEPVPPQFDLRYAGLPESAVRFDATTRTLSASVALADRDYKGLLVAGAEPEFRAALNRLFVTSASFKVSWQWLFWFYIVCTLGELCLSPVGLSMVSKLAPKAWGTMMMGTWYILISFGNYVAGLLGESYGTLHPATYFAYITGALTVMSLMCFLAVRKIRSLMHGVM
ncbi:MAG: peptide MFS transporter [Planctomycetes bacterium]|nr:peptide MFS transporter [Planctomycetota bacterium]